MNGKDWEQEINDKEEKRKWKKKKKRERKQTKEEIPTKENWRLVCDYKRMNILRIIEWKKKEKKKGKTIVNENWKKGISRKPNQTFQEQIDKMYKRITEYMEIYKARKTG